MEVSTEERDPTTEASISTTEGDGTIPTVGKTEEEVVVVVDKAPA